MMDLRGPLEATQKSRLRLWLMRRFFYKLVPFNRPHKIALQSIRADAVDVLLPYRKMNCNHLGGLHACALLTAAEFAAGVAILRHVDMRHYRLIMQEIRGEYHAQARTDVVASAAVPVPQQANMQQELDKDGLTQVPMQVLLHDTEEKHIASVSVLWQVKAWKQVRKSR